MDIVFVGAAMLAFAFIAGFLSLIYLISISTIKAYKEKELKEFTFMCFVWLMILGFALLIIGSI